MADYLMTININDFRANRIHYLLYVHKIQKIVNAMIESLNATYDTV